MKWYERAANGFETYPPAALTALGRLHYSGALGEADRPAAEEYFLGAAGGGHLPAVFALGYIALGRDSRVSSLQEACSFFKQAARGEHVPSMFLLAHVEAHSKRWISCAFLFIRALLCRVSAAIRRDSDCLTSPVPININDSLPALGARRGDTREEWFLLIARNVLAVASAIGGVRFLMVGRVWAGMAMVVIAFFLGVVGNLSGKWKSWTYSALIGLLIFGGSGGALLGAVWWISDGASGNSSFIDWLLGSWFGRVMLVSVVVCTVSAAIADWDGVKSPPDVSAKDRVHTAQGSTVHHTTDSARVRRLRPAKRQSDDLT